MLGKTFRNKPFWRSFSIISVIREQFRKGITGHISFVEDESLSHACEWNSSNLNQSFPCYDQLLNEAYGGDEERR